MTAPSDPYRLPTSVTPSHYDLELTPDLDAATFAGTVVIAVEAHESTQEVVLNAIELEIDAATVDGVSAEVALDEEHERATLTLPAALAAGAHEVRITFRGILNDKLHGFYRSTFTDADGASHTIATTQFESTDARRAFPCWDEPIHKATFAVSLVVPDDLLAISNAAETGRTPVGDGKVKVDFATTMKMSTYLVAFVVGPLVVSETVDVDGVPLRVVAPAHRAHLTPFALEVGAAALRYFTEWFGLAYPGDKLDLVAIPDFAFGAMENLGCVTFRETALLVDPAIASQAEQVRVADVINHEIAHMWFGDLVTMKWWNGIWLNEAFATFMEIKATDAFRPQWERWTSFGLERGAAYAVDALAATRPIEFPVVSPAEAEGMFDVLTYQKGCAVMRMLEQYLGEEPFREGLRHYMRTHGYANTETADLWDAIEHASGQPVRAVMDSWILQGGYPIVDLAYDGSTLTLRQERFGMTDEARDETRWSVPVLLRLSVDGVVREERVLLDGPTATLPIDGLDWVVGNAGGSGFYRVRYAGSLLDALVAADPTVVAMATLERFGIGSDAWSSVRAGLSSVADVLPVLRFLATTEPEQEVWAVIGTALGTIHKVADPAQRSRLAAITRELAQPVLDAIGAAPVAGESERTGSLRASLLGLLGMIGEDPAVLEWARGAFDAYLADASSVPADLIGAALGLVAAKADEATYDLILDRFHHPATPQEEMRFLGSLVLVEDESLFRRTLALALSDEVRTQNAPMLLAGALGSNEHGTLAWKEIRQGWDTITARFPSNLAPRIVGGLAGQIDPALLTDASAFLAEHPMPSGTKQIAQTLESMKVSVDLAERERPNLDKALS